MGRAQDLLDAKKFLGYDPNATGEAIQDLVALRDIMEIVAAMRQRFPYFPKLDEEDYDVDPRTGEYIMRISDKDLYLKYKQQVHEWVKEWLRE